MQAKCLLDAARAALYALSDYAKPEVRVEVLTVLLEQCFILLTPGDHSGMLQYRNSPNFTSATHLQDLF